jgi:hypothetical protein
VEETFSCCKSFLADRGPKEIFEKRVEEMFFYKVSSTKLRTKRKFMKISGVNSFAAKVSSLTEDQKTFLQKVWRKLFFL